MDASVALKWVLDESGQGDALGLLDEDMLHAPDFLLVDVANVLWSKVRRRLMDRARADAAHDAIAGVPTAYTTTGELAPSARTLANAPDLSVYDALYAALAPRLRRALAMADGRLASAVGASGMAVSARLVA